MLGLPSRKAEDSAFAFVDKLIDAIFGDGRLGAEAQLLFDFDFPSQTLAVEAVLVTLIMPGHREKSLVRIFIRPTPCVVHAHRVVGGDRPVQKAPTFLAVVFFTQLAEGIVLRPELEDGVLTGNKVAVGNRLEHDEIC